MSLLLGGNRPDTTINATTEEPTSPIEKSLNEQGITIQNVAQTPSDIGGQQVAIITDFDLEEVKITSVITGNFEPIIARGLNEQRPELLVLNEFLPIYNGNTNVLSSAGKFINLQFDVNKIKTKNIIDLINTLKDNESTKSIIEELESKVSGEIRKTEDEVNFLRTVVLNSQQAKQAFKIKERENSIRKEMARLRNANIRSVKTIKEIFTEDLGFSASGYEEFLDTKILLTLLEDLKRIVLLHSPHLFEGDLSDRVNDNSSIKITKINEVSGVPFKLFPTDLASRGFGASNLNDWPDLFADKLPDSSVDQLLFLSSFLSKEFSISAGLARNSITSLLEERFPEAPKDARMFNAILGSAGNTILDPVFGENSLSNLLRFEDQNDNIILSFENKFIENDGITYVPGTNRFIDSILKSVEAPLTVNPIDSFKSQFDRSVNLLESSINNSLLLDNLSDRELKNALKPARIFRKFMETMDEILTPGIDRLPIVPGVKNKISKIFALFNEAKEDKEMKQLLFKVFIAEGLTRVNGASSSPNVSSFYTKINESGFTANDLDQLLINELQPGRDSLGGTTIAATITSLLETIMEKLQVKYASNGPNVPTDDNFTNIRELSLFSRGFLNDDESVFRKMNNFLDYLDFNATQIGLLDINEALAGEFGAVYTRVDLPGATKANAISLIYLAWMVFEMFMSFVNEYFTTTFALNQNGSSADIPARIDQTQFFSSYNSVRNHLGFSMIVSRVIEEDVVNENVQVFRSSEERLKREINIIRDIVSVFSAVNQRLKTATTNLVDFFQENFQNRNRLVGILSQVDGQDKLSALSNGQVNASIIALENMKLSRNNPETPFVDDTFVSQELKNAFFAFLKNPRFRTESGFNLKLLTIGLPSGFMDSLESRFDRFLIGAKLASFNRQENQEKDVIKINVYKQDLQFEDIVFKPISFLFEISRFTLLNSFNEVEQGGSFEQLMNSVITKNVSLKNNSYVSDEKLENIKRNDKYNFLNGKQKEELVENHVADSLFKQYIKFSTGADLSEKEFLMNEEVLNESVDPEIATIFRNVLQTHISNLASRNITFEELKAQGPVIRETVEAIENNAITNRIINSIETKIDDLDKKANVEITEDLKNFLNIFSHKSFLFGASSVGKKISSPKLFERIFTIPIDPDDFEIDVNKTTSTSIGSQVWNQDAVKDKIIQEEDDNGNIIFKMKPKREQENSPELIRFFATIEHMPEVLQQEGFTPVKIEAPTNKRREERSARQRDIRERLKSSGLEPTTDVGLTTTTGIEATTEDSGASIGSLSSHSSDSDSSPELSFEDI